MSDLRYPIGKFDMKPAGSAEQRKRCIEQITEAPARLRAAVKGLSAEQLDTPYRPGGWTVRQVAHHIPDSHMNAYIRFKLALTEQEPTIKPYQEDLWAELADTKDTAVEVSLALMETLHQRWTNLLRSIGEEEWRRTFRHPELGTVRLDTNVALYGWHGRHHVAHITGLRGRMK